MAWNKSSVLGEIRLGQAVLGARGSSTPQITGNSGHALALAFGGDGVVTHADIRGDSGYALPLGFGADGNIGNSTITGDTGYALPLAFGSGLIAHEQNITGSSGFALPLAFGSGSVVATITGGFGFALPLRFGNTGALLSTTTGFVCFIAGVDRTSYCSPNSLDVSRSLGSIKSARFQIHDSAASFRPAIGSEVVWYFDGTRIFGGTIESREEFWPIGENRQLMRMSIDCAGYGAILQRRIVQKHYTLFMGGLANITIADLVTNFLDNEGISFSMGADPGISLEEQTFNGITVHEAIKQILDKANWDYEVDDYKILRIFSSSAGKGSCPFSITDANNTDWRGMSVKQSRGQYRNRQGVKNNRDLKALWTDTVQGDDISRSYPTTYVLNVKPLVKVNGTEKVVVEISEIGTTTFDFYYIDGGIGVFQVASATPLTSGDTMTIGYPSPLSWIYWTQDSAEIAARAAVEGGSGKYEHVEEAKDLPDVAAIQQVGAGLLSRHKAIPTTFDGLQTRLSGAEPGQILTVNTTKPLASGTFLITDVSSRDEEGKYLRHTISGSSGSYKGISDARRFFSRMIERDKQPLDRIIESIVFVLAGTVEGLTNPGLTTGVKEASKIAQKDGVARECTLYFKTAPTTTKVIVDVRKNGTSIFGTTKMEFPVNGTTVQTQFVFASDPLLVSKGDIFTVNVTQADSAAMDGTLELTVIG